MKAIGMFGGRWPVIVAACLMLVACGEDSWLGSTAPAPLPGKRESVLTEDTALSPDAASRQVILPAPEVVPSWPEAGGFPPHAMYHLALGNALHRVWSASVGAGSDKRRAFITQPIVAGGRVFAMDAQSVVSAFNLKNGDRLWKSDLAVPDADSGSYGGGLAFDRGALFATTGFGEIVRMDAATGKVRWHKPLSAPVRGAPTARAGRLLMITVTNQTLALAEDDGRRLWNYDGIEEETLLLGGTSPAVDGNTVVVPYSSGELYALRIENGTQLWNETLNTLRRTNEVATLTDIRGLPVIDKGRVFAAANSDIFAAVDLATGRRPWDRKVGFDPDSLGGGRFPLPADQHAVGCVFPSRHRPGRMGDAARAMESSDDKSGEIVWTGPVLASNRLIIASSIGKAYSISPYTGKMLGAVDLPDGVTIPPIVADRTLIFVTDEGELVAIADRAGGPRTHHVLHGRHHRASQRGQVHALQSSGRACHGAGP